ncbi:MAG: Holliday junction resolvase RuvX [Chlamydiota bacterium]
MGRIAGIDYGTVRIGVAISDENQIIAGAHSVMPAKKRYEETVDALLLLLAPYKLEAIVLGMPYKLSGKTSFMGDEVTHFAELLKKKTSIPLIFWDERLTSMQAERSLKESGMNRKKRSKIVDSVAAVILLQNYLDSLSWQRDANRPDLS